MRVVCVAHCQPVMASFSSHRKHTAFIKPGKDGGVIDKALTYRELDQETTRVASVIAQHVQPGERAVLVYPPSLDFMICFLACLKAGVIAVPVFPPNPTRRDTLQMFCKIVAGCGAKVALTNAEYNYAKKMASITQVFGKLKNKATWPSDLQWVLTDNNIHAKASASSFQPVTPKASDIAFLQYTSGTCRSCVIVILTEHPKSKGVCVVVVVVVVVASFAYHVQSGFSALSGSTSDPKGVMITHGNLGHNLTIITNDLKAATDTVVVSWVSSTGLQSCVAWVAFMALKKLGDDSFLTRVRSVTTQLPQYHDMVSNTTQHGKFLHLMTFYLTEHIILCRA